MEIGLAWATLAGFVAQMVDGSLGMGYGILCTSLLIALGASPILANQAVKTAEMFTSAAAGLAHWKAGNVNGKLVLKLSLWGGLGSLLGVGALAYLATTSWLRPLVAVYLMIMGLVLVRRVFAGGWTHKIEASSSKTRPVAVLGGFLDALGGGGWGAVVTSRLLFQGMDPKVALGSVAAAEFVVTLTQVTSLTAVFGVQFGPMVMGLILGGLLAAPAGALLVRKVNPRPLVGFVGLLLIVLSAQTFAKALFF